MKTACYILILTFVILSFPTASFCKDNKDNRVEDTIIIMKPLVVKGELDKPAVFIVPRARLRKYTMFGKSFFNDIMREVDPGFSLGKTEKRLQPTKFLF